MTHYLSTHFTQPRFKAWVLCSQTQLITHNKHSLTFVFIIIGLHINTSTLLFIATTISAKEILSDDTPPISEIGIEVAIVGY